MGSININTGGGGLVIGDGGVATGVGSRVALGDNTALSKAELAGLLGALGGLKASLITAGVDSATSWAAQINELEQRVIAGEGRFATEPAQRVLARLRYAALGVAPVEDALAKTTAHLGASAPAADVFISYKRGDRARVGPLVEALRALAVSVWIDDELAPGDSFTTEICDQIDRCRTQIVCWTPAACESDWVRGEAELGRRRGVLLCVQLEPCRVQPPFNMLHTEDLSAWRGGDGDSAWIKVLHALGVRLTRPGLATLPNARRNEALLAAWRRDYPSDPFNARVSHGQ